MRVVRLFMLVAAIVIVVDKQLAASSVTGD